MTCVDFLRQHFPATEIEVVLPRLGPLSEELERRGYHITVQPLWVLRKRYGFAGLISRLWRLPFAVLLAIKTIKEADLAYINTGVILNYMISARLFHSKSVIHVHELPVGKARRVFRSVVGFPRCKVLFNSDASRKNLDLDRRIKQFVVHNGVDLVRVNKDNARDNKKEPLQVLLLGRISDWKGQDLLIEALDRLPRQELCRYQVRIAGDVFEGALFRQQLISRIQELRLSDFVLVEDFQRDPSALYEACDIVLVPSRKPEPFGMVAIEAMAHGKPVIAARHGGLLEIVREDQTGWFFYPNDAEDLAGVLRAAEAKRQILPLLGENGRQEFLRRFTTECFREAFLNALLEAPHPVSWRTRAMQVNSLAQDVERNVIYSNER